MVDKAFDDGKRGGAAGGRMSRAELWLRATRPFSFPCSMMPVLVATAAASPISEWHWGMLWATLLAVLFMHIGGNMFNDYMDFVRGVDTLEEGDEGRPGRFLVTGAMHPRQVLTGVIASWLLATAVAGFLAWRAGWPVLALGAAGIFGAYAYTGPPFRLKAHALGEVTMLVFFGPLLMSAAAYVQVARVSAEVLVLSVPMGLSVSLILVGNNLRDMEEDAEGEVRTLAHVLGARRMRAVYALLAVLCPTWIAAAGIAWRKPIMVIVLAALAVEIGPLRAVLGGRRLPDVDARTARYMLVLGAVGPL